MRKILQMHCFPSISLIFSIVPLPFHVLYLLSFLFLTCNNSFIGNKKSDNIKQLRHNNTGLMNRISTFNIWKELIRVHFAISFLLPNADTEQGAVFETKNRPLLDWIYRLELGLPSFQTIGNKCQGFLNYPVSWIFF